MAEGVKKDFEGEPNLTVIFSITPETQGIINSGAAEVGKLLHRRDITPERYLTFLFTNAYFYAEKVDFDVRETAEEPEGVFVDFPEELTMTDREPNAPRPQKSAPEITIVMPERAHDIIEDGFGSLKTAAEAMNVFTAAVIQGKTVQLEFPGNRIAKFPFVTSLQYVEPNPGNIGPMPDRIQ